jgi:hypothetical protein
LKSPSLYKKNGLMRFFLVLILFLLSLQPVSSASGFAGEFLALGTGARALALGNAYVALSQDATAGYWNPAGLASLNSKHLHLTHAERFSGVVDQDFFALAMPGPWFDGIGFSLLRVGVSDIKFTTLQDATRPIGPNNRPVVASTETSADYAFYLSGGRRFGDRLALGLSGKFIYRDIGSFSAYGVGLDLGLRYDIAPGISLAANVRDITSTPIVWDTDSTDRINPSLLLGMAYTRPFAGGSLSAALASRRGGDATDTADQTPLNAGVEYTYEKVAFRVGFEEDRTALGLGLKLRRNLDVDIAYLQHEELEATYLLSAGFHF